MALFRGTSEPSSLIASDAAYLASTAGRLGSKRGCWNLIQSSDGVDTDKYGHAAVSVGDSLLVMGGCNGYGSFTAATYLFHLGLFLPASHC
jgi:hypothetical protein